MYGMILCSHGAANTHKQEQHVQFTSFVAVSRWSSVSLTQTGGSLWELVGQCGECSLLSLFLLR